MVAYVTDDNSIATTDGALRTRVAGSPTTSGDARPRLALGRLPASGESDAVVLSHRLFEEQFHGDSSILGRPAHSRTPVTIVGILHEDVRFELFHRPGVGLMSGTLKPASRSGTRLKTQLAAAGGPSTSSPDSSLTLRLKRHARNLP
jgi:hypothetical protein